MDVPPVFGARNSKVVRLFDANEAGAVLVYGLNDWLNAADIDVLESPFIFELEL